MLPPPPPPHVTSTAMGHRAGLFGVLGGRTLRSPEAHTGTRASCRSHIPTASPCGLQAPQGKEGNRACVPSSAGSARHWCQAPAPWGPPGPAALWAEAQEGARPGAERETAIEPPALPPPPAPPQPHSQRGLPSLPPSDRTRPDPRPWTLLLPRWGLGTDRGHPNSPNLPQREGRDLGGERDGAEEPGQLSAVRTERPSAKR